MFTEDPFQNTSYVYEDTVARLNNLTINVLNVTLEKVIGMLTDWQKEHLMEIDSELGVECLLRMWFQHRVDGIEEDSSFCYATWDKTYCLPPAPVGAKITQRCFDTEQGEITRVCLDNSTWSQGDVCKIPFETLSSIFGINHYMSVIVANIVFYGSILSLFCLGVSLATFYFLRGIWSQRLNLQAHLMLVLVLRFVILFVVTEPFISKRENSYKDDDTLCKILVSAYLYSCVTLVMWMLIQGIYLNGKLTTNVLGDETKIRMRFYYFLGWFFPAGVLVLYLIEMTGNHQEEVCWKGYSGMKEIRIILFPILVAVSLNAIFLLNILRVVIFKSHNFNSSSETAKLISIAKATGILFPVLGINNMLLVYNPGGEYEKYFTLVNTFFGSTQGVLVAIVYCGMSKDVHRSIRLSYNRFIVRKRFQGMPRNTQRETIWLRRLRRLSDENSGGITSILDTHQV